MEVFYNYDCIFIIFFNNNIWACECLFGPVKYQQTQARLACGFSILNLMTAFQQYF